MCLSDKSKRNSMDKDNSNNIYIAETPEESPHRLKALKKFDLTIAIEKD